MEQRNRSRKTRFDVLKRQILGKGGLGRAALFTGISYSRLSRIVNGWIEQSTEEATAIERFLRTSDQEIELVIGRFQRG